MNCSNCMLFLIITSAYLLPGVFSLNAIVGGHVVAPPDYNYHVSINIAGHVSQCGGGIINNDSIITAARCVVGSNGELIGKDITIVANTYELGRGLHVKVEKVYVPIEIERRLINSTDTGIGIELTKHNSIGDIAILKLKRPLDTKIYDLTELNVAKFVSFNNKEAVITGFGWNMMNDNNVGGHSDYRLRYAYVEVRNEEECHADHPNMQINARNFCARIKQGLHQYANQRRGVCHGDIGGPLVLNGKIAAGILSKVTSDCSEEASSAIYTRVGHYRYFVANALKNTVTRNLRVLYVNTDELS